MKCKPKAGYYPSNNRLVALFLALLLLSNLVIGYYAYHNLLNAKISYTETEIRRTLEQARQNILVQLNDIERASQTLANDYKLQLILESSDNGYALYEDVKDFLIPTIQKATKITLNPIYMAVYVSNRNLKESYSHISDDDPLLLPRESDLFYMNRIEGKDWFKKIHINKRNRNWLQVEDDSKYQNISFFHRIISYDSFKQIGYIRIVVRTKELFKSLYSLKSYGKIGLYLVDGKENHIIFSNSSTQESYLMQNSNSKANLKIVENLQGTDWSLQAYVPYSELRKEASKVRYATFVICIITFMIISILGVLISNSFSVRIKRIVKSIGAFREGDFKNRIKYKGNDEFSLIAYSFNKMADNIDELIQKVYITGIQKKEAELDALQAQINPHFLYNTLSSINSLANLGEITKVTEMISGLSKFYRLTLNNGEIIYSIADEIQQVQAYIDIQSIKYGNQFDVSFHVDSSILEFQTVKLVLQPFVENILKHAWYNEHLHIKIMAHWEGDSIVFEVIDNGIGMKKETMDRILNKDETTTGYGIKNVDERIKLHYGSEYGIYIYSRRGIGTTVQIKLPAQYDLPK